MAADPYGDSQESNDISGLFDVAPTALWLEDYSRLYALFEQWRAQGVTDLREFLMQDPAHLAACSNSIRLLQVNQSTLKLYAAASFEELAGRLGEVLRDDTYDAFLNELEQLWQGQPTFQSKTVNYSLEGRRLDILLKGVILPGHESDWKRVLVSIEDITELENARRRLTSNEQYARGVFTQAPVSLWVEDFSSIKRLLDDIRQQGILDFRTFVDVHPEFVDRCMAEIRVLDVNRYTLFLYGAGEKNELLKRLPEVFRDDMRQSFQQQLIDLWEGQLFQQREVVNYALDGKKLHVHLQFSMFPGHEHDWSMALLALTDITARKKAESYLEYLGKHDVLTGLKNRSFYVDEVSRMERKGLFPVTAIILDLNNLKTVNDEFGHVVGDSLLRRAGEVLTKVLDKNCQAARIGGDEFVVLMSGADAKAGEEMLANIHKLIELNNQFYNGPALSMSMGMTTCRKGEHLEDTLREADLAMYENKRSFYLNTGADRRRA
ncbi:sensor domain-containing diguanylate cyclase [Alcaligenaceae bacterium]|nr:sensor domain-containing diguanylate cyclase [Alcaligenaceae bacterium]